MSSLKKLAGQTAIYGVSSIVGRVLNYLLVPLYTNVFLPEEFGVVTELYAYVGFLVVLLTYGMETAFFRYSQFSERKNTVFSTGLWSLLVSSVLFVGLVFTFIDPIADFLEYQKHPEYIRWFSLILALDAIVSIPFAKLRAENKAVKFAFFKFINIGVNVGLNLFFIVLCPILYKSDGFTFIHQIYTPEVGVGYIFISNLVASAVTFVLLLPELRYLKFGWHGPLWRKMIIYAAPLAVVGFAGIINEMLDRVLLKQLLPYDLPKKMAMIGIYGAVYKLSILMSLFNQAFRYAAEPFFFGQAGKKDSKVLYAKVLNYFTMLGGFIFIFILLYLDIFQYFIGENFREGLYIVPVLLMANLLLGVQINLSIWFKLTDKTGIGALISIIGALVTILLNVLWIPKFGYAGAAWATLICYAVMVMLTYLSGQKYFPVAYDIKRLLSYIAMALIIYFGNQMLMEGIQLENALSKYIINTAFLLAYLAFCYRVNRNELTDDFLKKN